MKVVQMCGCGCVDYCEVYEVEEVDHLLAYATTVHGEEG